MSGSKKNDCVKMLIMQSKSQLAKLLCVCAKRRRRMRRGERVRACARSPGGSYDAWRASASLAKPAVAGAENRAARQVCNANCAGRQPCSSLSVRLVARRPPAEERAPLCSTKRPRQAARSIRRTWPSGFLWKEGCALISWLLQHCTTSSTHTTYRWHYQFTRSTQDQHTTQQQQRALDHHRRPRAVPRTASSPRACSKQVV